MVLVGNKADMRDQRVVKEAEAQDISKQLGAVLRNCPSAINLLLAVGIPYIETSAKTGMSTLYHRLCSLTRACRHRGSFQRCGQATDRGAGLRSHGASLSKLRPKLLTRSRLREIPHPARLRKPWAAHYCR